jgi:biopolymer transport protein ExbD
LYLVTCTRFVETHILRPEVLMAMSVHQPNGSYCEPNVIPLIDVLLVLLIIFMVTASALKSYRVNLPAEPSPEMPAVAPIVLRLVDGNGYTINGQPIDKGDLVGEMMAIYEGRSQKILFIDAARTRSYQEVIEAFSMAKQAGVQTLSLLPKQRSP